MEKGTQSLTSLTSIHGRKRYRVLHGGNTLYSVLIESYTTCPCLPRLFGDFSGECHGGKVTRGITEYYTELYGGNGKQQKSTLCNTVQHCVTLCITLRDTV